MPSTFQGLGNVFCIADEVVSRKSKFEAKPPFLWVQPPALKEASQKTPVSPAVTGQHSLLPDRFEKHPYLVLEGKRGRTLFRANLPAFQRIKCPLVEVVWVVKSKQHSLYTSEQFG